MKNDSLYIADPYTNCPCYKTVTEIVGDILNSVLKESSDSSIDLSQCLVTVNPSEDLSVKSCAICRHYDIQSNVCLKKDMKIVDRKYYCENFQLFY